MNIDFSQVRDIALSNVNAYIARWERVNIESHRGDGDRLREKAIQKLDEMRKKRDAILAIPPEEWEMQHAEYLRASNARVERDEAAFDALWEGKSDRNSFFRDIS